MYHKPSDNDRKIYDAILAIENEGAKLPAAVAIVAEKFGYSVKGVYGMRGRVKAELEKQKAPKELIPAGHRLKGLSSLVDANGEIKQQWVKTYAEQDDWAQWIDAALAKVATIEPLEQTLVVPPSTPHTTVYPIADWHIGLAAAQVNGWTMEKAADVYRRAFAKLVYSKLPTDVALLVFMGDFTHTDNFTNTTPRSNKKLDVTGDYAQVVEAAMQLIVDVVALARAAHNRVEIVYLAGNHDEATAVVMQAALKQLYKKTDNVLVHETKRFFYKVIGQNLLGFTHGHTLKRDDLPMIMATDRPQLWGAATNRVWHTGHVHHETRREFNGCTVETHSSPVPRDAWHEDAGYRSQQAIRSIVYDNDGEVARTTINLTPKG